MTDRPVNLVIRHAEPADHAPIVAVVDDWWGGRRMREMLPKLFFVHFRPTSFVAEADGAIRGFLVGFLSQTWPEQAYVHFVGVDPACRGHGVGRMLYERFFAAVAAAGRSGVGCVTSPINRASIAFHRRLGFEVIAPAEACGAGTCHADYDGLGEDRVQFRYRIEPAAWKARQQ